MSKEGATVHIQDREDQEEQPNKLDESFDARYDDDNPNNNHEFDDQDLKDILEEEGSSKEEMMLRFKVEELQKICNSLSDTNRKLINKITKMEEEFEQKNSKSDSQNQVFVDEYSQLNVEFTEIQQLINQYRESLNQFQKNVLTDLKSKDTSVHKLEDEIKVLHKSIKDLEAEKQELEKANKQLETRNQGLILQVENLQKTNVWLEERINSKSYTSPYLPNMSTRYDTSYVDDEISMQMQTELEAIINKLVKQLEYERSIKKKLNDQIKRMSLELMQSQREIMQKNRKLYSLQMKMLKNNKSSINVDISQKFRTKPDDEKTQRIQNKSDQRVSFKTFSLMEMINEEVMETITPKQRKIIGMKILELYERKLEKGDFSNIIPESLMIHNFNHKRPDLISIRKTQNHVYEECEEEQGEEYLIWNLAFIMENVFREESASSKQFRDIVDFTSEMLQKQYQNSRDEVKRLKTLLAL